jgi:hypothetical protein
MKLALVFATFSFKYSMYLIHALIVPEKLGVNQTHVTKNDFPISSDGIGCVLLKKVVKVTCS